MMRGDASALNGSNERLAQHSALGRAGDRDAADPAYRQARRLEHRGCLSGCPRRDLGDLDLAGQSQRLRLRHPRRPAIAAWVEALRLVKTVTRRNDVVGPASLDRSSAIHLE